MSDRLRLAKALVDLESVPDKRAYVQNLPPGTPLLWQGQPMQVYQPTEDRPDLATFTPEQVAAYLLFRARQAPQKTVEPAAF